MEKSFGPAGGTWVSHENYELNVTSVMHHTTTMSQPSSPNRDGPYAPVRTEERHGHQIDLSSWDEDEDEAGLARYSVSHQESHDVSQSWWTTVRQQARQRRASRLLAWNELSRLQRVVSVLEMYCCDATDGGILLVLCLTFLWLLVGYVVKPKISYWLAGISVLVVRLSARRTVERYKHRRQQTRERASSDMQMAEIV